MAPIPTSAARRAVIQGSFLNGRPEIPVVAPSPAPIQPRIPGPQRVLGATGSLPASAVPAVNTVQRRPSTPYATPPLAHHQRMPHPNVAQREIAQPAPVHATPPLTHQQRMAQPNVAQPRGVHPQAVPPSGATTRGPVVQRVGNGEAFKLPAKLSNFGGGGGHPLPNPVRQKMESFFNTSFSDVRVHVGAQASSIGALAFTHGSNLYFAPGKYNPNTAQGHQLLGHELTHVVQQRAGRVRNPFGSGVAVVHDHAMEAEADRMGQRVAANVPDQTKLEQQPNPGESLGSRTNNGQLVAQAWYPGKKARTAAAVVGAGAVLGVGIAAAAGATIATAGVAPILAGGAALGYAYWDYHRSGRAKSKSQLAAEAATTERKMNLLNIYALDARVRQNAAEISRLSGELTNLNR